MRLARRKEDYWELRSGEESHRQHPETFWIPPLEERQNLKRGDSVRLIFEIEAINDEGEVEVQGERMWVTVAEKCGEVYIGILQNQPALLELADDVYLRRRAEIPFLAEHVIDIDDDPPKEYVEWVFSQPVAIKWPRDE